MSMIGITSAVETYRNFNIGTEPIYMHKDGNTYVQIYYHDTGAGYWTRGATSTFLYSTDARKYALFGKLDQLTYEPGVYQFILEYPGYSATKYNEWTQTSNPINYNNTVLGYNPIHIDYNGRTSSIYFNGISAVPSHDSCYIKSYCGIVSDWWFAICSFTSYNGGVPGPEWRENNNVVVNRIRMWLRVK